jgi:hypothetical protein
MMEAAGISETYANLFQTTRRNNPEDNHLQNAPNKKKLVLVDECDAAEIFQNLKVGYFVDCFGGSN